MTENTDAIGSMQRAPGETLSMALKPALGRVQLVFYGVGVIIGAGVYSVIGAAAGLAGGWLWLSFAIGAAVALLTALSYAEMTTAFPLAGAEHLYVRKAWPDAAWLSFGVGVCILFGGAATAATVATAFGNYLHVLVPVPPRVSAAALLAISTALCLWGLRESIWVTVVFTLIEIAGLALVVFAASAAEFTLAISALPPWGSVLSAASMLFFVYLGFEELANLAEEARDPARDLPFALLMSLGLTTVLYVAVALALPLLATPQALESSDAPLALAVESAWPGQGGWLAAIALFATANTVIVTLIAASRLAYAMAREGQITRSLAALSETRRTPRNALILVFVLSTALVPIGGVKLLAELSSFAALLAFMIVNLVVIVLRYRMPDQPRPFRVPLSIGPMPVLPLLAIVSITGLLGYFDWQVYSVAAAVFVASATLYATQRLRSAQR